MDDANAMVLSVIGLVVLLAVLLVTPGDATSPVENGMTQAQVRSLLGAPYSVINSNSNLSPMQMTTEWVYLSPPQVVRFDRSGVVVYHSP